MLGPNWKPRSWGSRVLVLPDVLGSESCSSPRIIPSCTVGVSFPGLFTERWCGDEGPHSLFSFSNFPGSGCPFHQWGVEGGPTGRSQCDGSAPLSAVSSKCRRPSKQGFQQEGSPIRCARDTQNLMFQGTSCERWPTVRLPLFMFLSWLLVLFYGRTCAFYRLW